VAPIFVRRLGDRRLRRQHTEAGRCAQGQSRSSHRSVLEKVSAVHASSSCRSAEVASRRDRGEVA
jgi:hypothetical protein